VKDLCVQRKVNDLVIGTFGRGIYILDDYSALRAMKPEALAKDAVLFPPRDAQLFIPSAQFGGAGKAFQGASFYTADNPPYGATLTYHMKDSLKTRKQIRQDAEKAAEKKGQPVPYPTPEELRLEAEEEAPTVFLVIKDADGNVVRTVTGPTAAGTHRVTWDLRDPGAALPTARTREPGEDEDDGPPRGSGPLVAPGKYTATLHKRYRGEEAQLAGPVEFAVALDTLGSPDADAVKEQVAFHREVLKLSRAVTGATNVATELGTRLDAIRRALDTAPKADEASKKQVREMIDRNREILRAFRGDSVLAARNENVPLSISSRVGTAARASAQALAKPTGTQKEQYAIAAKEFAEELAKLKKLADVEVPALEKKLDAFGAPWTPGRLPAWDGGK